MPEVTEILKKITREQIRPGDKNAADSLLPLVYQELKQLATNRLANERKNHTLQSTALVHEAYLRLVANDGDQSWDSKAHFFAAAAIAMRRILVEHARARSSSKRGGELDRVEFDEIQLGGQPAFSQKRTDQLLELDEALSELAQLDETKARLVELRFFGGCTNLEAAKILEISHATADRYWAYSRAWLQTYMKS